MMLLALMLVSSRAFAYGFPVGDVNGDFYGGTVSSPILGATVVDTGAYGSVYGTRDYDKVIFTASCTLGCALDMGVYDSSGTAVNVQRIYMGANTSQQIQFNRLIVYTGYHLEVKVGALNLGTINASIETLLDGGQ